MISRMCRLPLLFSKPSMNPSVVRLCSKAASLPKLTLFSKSGDCSLCDDMKEELEPYLHHFEFEEIDILLDEHAFWRRRYKYEIPVVHLNGKILMKHWFNQEKMNAALADSVQS